MIPGTWHHFLHHEIRKSRVGGGERKSVCLVMSRCGRCISTCFHGARPLTHFYTLVLLWHCCAAADSPLFGLAETARRSCTRFWCLFFHQGSGPLKFGLLGRVHLCRCWNTSVSRCDLDWLSRRAGKSQWLLKQHTCWSRLLVTSQRVPTPY